MPPEHEVTGSNPVGRVKPLEGFAMVAKAP